MTGSYRRICFLILVLTFFVVSVQAADNMKLAVLELRNEAGITDAEMDYLTDRVRDAASRSLAGRGFLIMTRESLVELLPPGTNLADCTDAECEIEVGRNIGADYIVTGEILKFSGQFRLNLKAHHSQSGAFLGSETAKGGTLEDLESSVLTVGNALFGRIRSDSGKRGGMASTPGKEVSEGAIGEKRGDDWLPQVTQKAVVRFESDPPGAVVMADGNLFCQATPCAEELVLGSVMISMQKKRYFSKEEVLEVKKGASPVSWTLEPEFGWLSVTSEPTGLPVKINGEPAGNTPLQSKELDPGAYEVLVSDLRYYDKGERIVMKAGEQRTVAVSLTPRQGAIEVSAKDASNNAATGDVYVDGDKVGAAPGTFMLLIGSHDVEIRSSSGTWKGQVKVTERQVAEVEAKVAGAVAFNGRQNEHQADSSDVVSIDRQIERLKASLANLRLKYTNDHPDVQKVRSDLEGLKKKRANEMEKVNNLTADGMVLIPGGSFMMGCVPGDSECEADEKPRHRVTVDSFYMDKYEVTQSQYEKVMGQNPSNFKNCGGNCPVEEVSWNDAKAYCEKTGKRLPTEAEWEYAARGGKDGEKWHGEIDRIAWYSSNSGSKTHPVGQKQANGFGLYDMSGNVWEWCNDWYDEDYYSSSPANNPTGASSSKYRVLRGGGWGGGAGVPPASYRSRTSPTYAYYGGGFRCVRGQ